MIAGGYDTPGNAFVRTHAKAFVDHPNCELVAVADADIEKAKEFADIWKVKLFSQDYISMIVNEKPDLVSICTPTDSHEEVFTKVANLGVSKIWLEKPAAHSREAILRMIDVAKKNKTVVWINYYRRYDQGFLKVLNTLSSLKPLHHIRAIYTKGLHHNGSHMIDLLLWMFEEIENIKISSILHDNEYPTVSAFLSTIEGDIELVGLDHKNFEMFELDIIGSKGRIRIYDGGQEIVFEKVVESKYYKNYFNLDVDHVHKDSYGVFMREGLRMGLAGHPMPGFQNELKIHEILDHFEQQIHRRI